MKTVMIILATISLFSCKKQNKEQDTCHTCVYTGSRQDTTVICDDPQSASYEYNTAVNHKVFVANKFGYCIN